MRCGVCQGRTGVVDTLTASESVVRRRECKLCGHRFNTKEVFFEKTVRKPKATRVTMAGRRARKPREPDISLPTDLGWSDADYEERELMRELEAEYGWTKNYD